MIDHIDLVVGDWALIGERQEVARALQATESLSGRTWDGQHVRLLRRPRVGANGVSFQAQLARSGQGNTRNPITPILSGRLEHVFGRDRVPQQARGEHLRLGLVCGLNINRFLMAQYVPPRMRLDRPRVAQPHATAMRQEWPQHGDEFAFTEDTNVLLGSTLLYRYAISKGSDAHLTDLVSAVSIMIGSGLAYEASAYGVQVIPFPYYSLRRIEFVWEFDHDDPLTAVERMTVPLRALGDSSRVRNVIIERETAEVRENSLAASVQLRDGCVIGVYAKTNRRIRFKVRLRENRIAAVLDGKRTTRTLSDLASKVRQLGEDATETMTHALAHLDLFLDPPPSNVSITDLCALIGRAAPNMATARVVIGALKARGSVVAPKDAPIRSTVDQLCDLGVLVRSRPRFPTFRPTGDYAAATLALRDLR